MTLTKTHIIDTLYRNTGLNKPQATHAVETFLETVKKTLEAGEDVLISGFGKFCVQEKRERRGRNPATGEDLILSPRKVISFKCSPILRKKVNE